MDLARKCDFDVKNSYFSSDFWVWWLKMFVKTIRTICNLLTLNQWRNKKVTLKSMFFIFNYKLCFWLDKCNIIYITYRSVRNLKFFVGLVSLLKENFWKYQIFSLCGIVSNYLPKFATCSKLCFLSYTEKWFFYLQFLSLIRFPGAIAQNLTTLQM